MLPTARRACTWRTEHSRRTLVERLDFITAAGAGMHGVVTPIAVFINRDGRLALQSWHPEVSLDFVRERTGFAFSAEGATPTPPPSKVERDALKYLDPDEALDTTLLKGLNLLEALIRSDHPRGVSEFSVELGLTKSNVLRVLQTLQAAGFVGQSDSGSTHEGRAPHSCPAASHRRRQAWPVRGARRSATARRRTWSRRFE